MSTEKAEEANNEETTNKLDAIKQLCEQSLKEKAKLEQQIVFDSEEEKKILNNIGFNEENTKNILLYIQNYYKMADTNESITDVLRCFAVNATNLGKEENLSTIKDKLYSYLINSKTRNKLSVCLAIAHLCLVLEQQTSNILAMHNKTILSDIKGLEENKTHYKNLIYGLVTNCIKIVDKINLLLKQQDKKENKKQETHFTNNKDNFLEEDNLFKDLVTKLNQLKEQTSKLLKKVVELEEDIKKEKQEKNTSNNKIGELNKKVNDLNKLINELEAKLLSKQEKTKTLTEQLASAQERAKEYNTIREENKNLRKEIANITGIITRLIKQVSTTLGVKILTKTDNNKQASTLTDGKKIVEQLQTISKAVEVSAKDKESKQKLCEQQELQITNLHNQLVELTNQVSVLEKNIKTKEEETITLLTNRKHLKAKEVKQSNEINKLNALVSKLYDTISRIKTEQSMEPQAHFALQINYFHSVISKQAQEIENLKNENDILSNKATSITTILQEKNKGLEYANSKQAEENKNLRIQLEELKGENQRLKKEQQTYMEGTLFAFQPSSVTQGQRQEHKHWQ